MARLVKDFIEVREFRTLDSLIEQLIAVRDSLPENAGAEVKLQGDDVFGRQISVSYARPQTAEEAECDARYAEAYRQSRAQAADAPRGRKLRIVA